MSSQRTRSRRLAVLALAAVAFPLAGCQDYFGRRDGIAFHAGETIAYNKAVHVIDPWPAAAWDTDLEFNGRRIVGAIERYETRADDAAGSGSSVIAVPVGIPSGPAK
jgi:hypothetical protein